MTALALSSRQGGAVRRNGMCEATQHDKKRATRSSIGANERAGVASGR